MKRIILFSALLAISTAAPAKQGSTITLHTSNFYIGGGLGFNTLNGGSGTGFQFLGGYQFDFELNGEIKTAIELGYMDSGNFSFNTFSPDNSGRVSGSADGVWLSVVESVPLSRSFNALARLGLDFGDDDGLMVGAGVGYNFNQDFTLRSEYVVRDAVNSFQFNLLYNF